MCGGVVNQIKKGSLLSPPVIFFKSVNIWQRYKQERGCLMHFVHLATTLLKDEEKQILTGHFGPFRWLVDSCDYGKLQAIYDYLFKHAIVKTRRKRNLKKNSVVYVRRLTSNTQFC